MARNMARQGLQKVSCLTMALEKANGKEWYNPRQREREVLVLGEVSRQPSSVGVSVTGFW